MKVIFLKGKIVQIHLGKCIFLEGEEGRVCIKNKLDNFYARGNSVLILSFEFSRSRFPRVSKKNSVVLYLNFIHSTLEE